MSFLNPEPDEHGFFTSNVTGVTTVKVQSDRIDDCLRYAYELGTYAITIGKVHGYKNNDISFLQAYPEIQRIWMNDIKGIDVSGLQYVEDSLEVLGISDNTQPLDLSRFPKLRVFRAEWHKKMLIPLACKSLEVLDLSKYKPSSHDLTELPELPRLRELSLVQGNIISIDGIQRYPQLERLELAYIAKLTDISAFTDGKNTSLEWFVCEKCPNMTNHAYVAYLPAAKVVRLHHCGTFSDLDFVTELPNLEDFRFMNTDVATGDVSPLLRCKKLKGVAFTNKRHFNYKTENIQSAISESRCLEV